MKDHVARAVDMGGSQLDRGCWFMLCTLLVTLVMTAGGKSLNCFKVGGFTEQECIEVLRRAPGLPSTSKENLELGLEFFMNIIKLEKTILVHSPLILRFSMEERVIPRYKVLQILNSKCLVKKEPGFVNSLFLNRRSVSGLVYIEVPRSC